MESQKAEQKNQEQEQNSGEQNQKAEKRKLVVAPPFTLKKIKKNDLCQHFVNTRERPSNFIMNIKPDERFGDYPQLQELMKYKDALIAKRNHPTHFIKADLKNYDLQKLGKFDVIYCDPPWKEYEEAVKDLPIYQADPQKFKSWTLDEISSLPIDKISETPSFLFLWVGTEHLNDGRELFKRWGYKRCEDIVWAKTNKTNKDKKSFKRKEHQIMHRVKEHCLVGLRGDVKRASDSHFIHANIDTDVIVDEEPPVGSLKKPNEMYSIIERFCLGRKRLELFGELHNIRDGWLTIGQSLPQTNFDLEIYNQYFQDDPKVLDMIEQSNQPNFHLYNHYPSYQGGRYLGTTPEIEVRRPKSPPKNNMFAGNLNNNQTRAQTFQLQQKQQYQQQQQQIQQTNVPQQKQFFKNQNKNDSNLPFLNKNVSNNSNFNQNLTLSQQNSQNQSQQQ